MKKALFFWLLFASARAQTIRKLEYFIDNDPGIGSGINVPINAASNINKSFSYAVNSISDGLHLLNIRSQDQNFFWSITNSKAFYKETITAPGALANIVKLEYFIDNDPGQDAGVNVPISAGTPINNQAFSFNVSSLTDGIHLISLRAKDANKFWSVVSTKAFYKETITTPPALPNVVKMEYFIDNDPGQNAGTNIPITAGTTLNNVGFSFNVNALSDGIHLLSIRGRDANKFWSVVSTKAFYKETITAPPTLPNIVKMEYFIDNDPGQDAGTNIPVTAATTLNNVGFSFNVNALSDGIHLLSIRGRDANKFWSVVSTKAIYKETITAPPTLANITKLEYFIDNDPGQGSGVNVPITAGISVNNVAFSFSANALSNGIHKLTLRAKDVNNRWGIVNINDFMVQDNIIVIGTTPSSWCLATVFSIPFTASGTFTGGNVFSAQLSDISGNFNTPVVLGTLTATTSGTISASIPNGKTLGSGYKIRVISSTPAITNATTKPITLISVCPAPCSNLLTLTHPADDILSGNITKYASSTNGGILASNYVQGSGTKATYQAKSILLTAGFRADNNVVFRAEIGGCSN